MTQKTGSETDPENRGCLAPVGHKLAQETGSENDPPRGSFFNSEGSHSDTLRGKFVTVPQVHFRTARGGILAGLLVSFLGLT